MKTISSHTFKHTLKDIHKHTENRKFCFVLGAGASFKSGIPTGGQLAKQWFDEMQERNSKEELTNWIKENNINKKDLATHYGTIYRKRFESDKTSGFEFLVQEMKKATPSFGHIVLAQILSRVPGHCVLTTNFDSLIESAIYQFTNKTPLVCGHESLSGYARPSKIHPLIIKIHRDLLLSPKSDPDEINKLDAGWNEPLDNIFSTHIPIVIGYGGNDGSLMTYFEQMKKPSNFFWCGLNENDLSNSAKKLIEKLDGQYVKIDGFDEIMHELLWVFAEIKPIKEELNEITKNRIDIADKQLNEIIQSRVVDDSKIKGEDISKELSAFEYSNLADKENDLEKKKDIYLKALKQYPETGWLWNEFTYFLQYIKKDYSNLDEYYQKALSVDPEDEYNNGNYASYLENIKKDYENAEKYYLKALSIDPENAINNGNYATYLHTIKKDYEKAEKYYLKALSIDPEDANFNGNYANYLCDIKKDYVNAERYYLKALSIDPEDANFNGNYANYLCDIKKDYVNAEKYYLKALSINPENANNNRNYAIFLENIKKDYKNVEKYYLKALSIDPEDADINVMYASYLENIKGEYKKAEKYYLKALSIDPEDANINWNYASYLSDIKKDYGNAEKYYLKALSIDPEDEDFNLDYAIYLSDIKKDHEKAETYFLKALSINPEDEDINITYAIYLNDIKKNYVNAEKHFLKALSTDPKDAENNGEYTQFLLKLDRKDEAASYLEKAFELNAGEKTDLLLKLWFYKYAHYPEFLEEAEKNMEELLSEGFRSIEWNLSDNIKVAIANNHPFPEKLKDFAKRITESDSKK